MMVEERYNGLIVWSHQRATDVVALEERNHNPKILG